MLKRRSELEVAAAGEEEKVGGATTFGRQSATPTVRRRVGFDSHATLTSYSSDMKEKPRNSVNSRDVCNASTRDSTPTCSFVTYSQLLLI